MIFGLKRFIVKLLMLDLDNIIYFDDNFIEVPKLFSTYVYGAMSVSRKFTKITTKVDFDVSVGEKN